MKSSLFTTLNTDLILTHTHSHARTHTYTQRHMYTHKVIYCWVERIVRVKYASSTFFISLIHTHTNTHTHTHTQKANNKRLQ